MASKIQWISTQVLLTSQFILLSYCACDQKRVFLWDLWDRKGNVGVSRNTLNTILGLSAILGDELDLERNVQAREVEGSCHQPPSSLPPGSVLRRLTKVSRNCGVAEAWVSSTLHLLGQGVCLLCAARGLLACVQPSLL